MHRSSGMASRHIPHLVLPPRLPPPPAPLLLIGRMKAVEESAKCSGPPGSDEMHPRGGS